MCSSQVQTNTFNYITTLWMLQIKVCTYEQLCFLCDLKHFCLLLLLATSLSNQDDFLQLLILQLVFLHSKINMEKTCTCRSVQGDIVGIQSKSYHIHIVQIVQAYIMATLNISASYQVYLHCMAGFKVYVLNDNPYYY